MRYFKYRHKGKTYKAAWKAELSQRSKAEQKQARRNAVLEMVGETLILTVVLVFCILAVLCIKQTPKPERLAQLFLYYPGCAIVFLASLVLGGFVGVTLADPIMSSITHTPRTIRRSVLHQACAHLRRYYGLQEPYVITKCFACSNENFKDHDVCLFVHSGELRITADLIRGFANGENDLGCYAFRSDEITLTKAERGSHLALELKAGKVTFLLGYRAKSFIHKYYLSA